MPAKKTIKIEKKVEEVDEKPKKKLTKERKVERELIHIIVFLGFLVVVFLAASAVFKSLNQVEYESLTFNKELFGELEVYRYTYLFRAPAGNLIEYNLFLRNNPSENDIPLDGKIKFFGRTAHITLDTTDLNECPNSAAAIGALTNFFRDNQFIVVSGNMDFTEAAIRNQNHITCENSIGKNVVQILRGDETKITTNEQCSTITVGPDCRILEAVEKYEVHAFLDTQNRLQSLENLR